MESHIQMLSSAKLTFTLTVGCVYQCAVRGQGASDPGLRGHPGHTVRPLRQCQQQLRQLAAHLHHLPQSTARPASELPGSDRHLRHHHQQGRDATTYLLQGGEEPQHRHGESDFYSLASAVASSVFGGQICKSLFSNLSVGLQCVPVLQEISICVQFYQLQSWWVNVKYLHKCCTLVWIERMQWVVKEQVLYCKFITSSALKDFVCSLFDDATYW